MKKHSMVLLCLLLIFIGCVKTPTKISYEEIEIREKNNLAQSKAELDTTYIKPTAHFIQASNQRQKCLVKFIGIEEELSQMTIYWDGNIKNGYADGLGRTFCFKDGILVSEHLVNYKNNANDFIQYYMKSWKDNFFVDSNDKYAVQTFLINNPHNFSINYLMQEISYEMPKEKREKGVSLVAMSPYHDSVIFIKQYPSFAYKVQYNNNIFDEIAVEMSEVDKETKQNGFNISKFKNGFVGQGEFLHGQLIRHTSLPIEFINKMSIVESEARNVMNNAIQAQNEATIIKNQYKAKICNNRKNISFMDNDLYYALCNEDNILLAASQRLSEEKEKLLIAKEREYYKNVQDAQLQMEAQRAHAATRAAQAAEMQVQNSANQNMILNNQLQQLNNNLLYNRLGL